MKPEEILKKYQAKLVEVKGILAKSDVTADDIAAIGAGNAELKAMQGQLAAIKELDELSSFLKVGDYLPSDAAQVLGGKSTDIAQITTRENDTLIEFAASNSDAAKTYLASRKPAYKGAMRAYLRSGGDFSRMPLDAAKTLQEGIDQSGGFTVPEDMLNVIISKKPAPTVVASKVQVYQTSRDALVIPRLRYTTDDKFTTGMRVTKTGEIPASATTAQATDPTFGSFHIPITTWMISLPLTNDLIEDSAFPLEQYIAAKFAETIQLLMEDQILNGSGAGENRGIITDLTSNASGTDADKIGWVKSGSNTAITPDNLIALKRAVPPQYASAPNLAFAMEYSITGGTVETMKDSQNRYLFKMGGASDGGLQGEAPDALLGRQIAYSQFMPTGSAIGTFTANQFPVVFGDLTGYYQVNRIGFTIQVLREIAARDNQIILLGRVRFGGQPCETWKIKGLKTST